MLEFYNNPGGINSLESISKLLKSLKIPSPKIYVGGKVVKILRTFCLEIDKPTLPLYNRHDKFSLTEDRV